MSADTLHRENVYCVLAHLLTAYRWEEDELSAVGIAENDFRRWVALLRERLMAVGIIEVD